MGALNSTQIVRNYPKGPPSCSNCIPGFSNSSQCLAHFGPEGCIPVLGDNWSASPLFVLLYLLWIFTVLCSIFWLVYPKRHKTHSRRRAMTPTVQIESDLESQNSTSVEAPHVLQYFRNSHAQTIATALLLSNGFALLSFYLLLTIDFYLDCENQWSLDNLCFFGTYRVFGNYENNSQAFLVIWVALVIYALVVSLGWKHAKHWTTVEVDTMEAADLVGFYVSCTPTSPFIVQEQTWALRVKYKLDKWSKLCLKRCGLWERRFVLLPINRTLRSQFRYYVFETGRFDAATGLRMPLSLLDSSKESIYALRNANGLDAQTRQTLQDYCGWNEIPLEFPPFLVHLQEEFTTPFYAYQLTIYLIWIYWTYWFVGSLLLFIVIVTGMLHVLQKRGILKGIHDLANHHHSSPVCRLENQENTFPANAYHSAKDLVPGDVLRIESNGSWTVPADLILTSGTCAVDESGLTGESMPCSKSAMDSFQGNHYLFAGTTVLEASENAVAVVQTIGCQATRGKVLSKVLFPPELRTQMDEEFPLVVLLLLIYALCAFLLSLHFQMENGNDTTLSTMLFFGIFTVSQILSPMLKIALVAGRLSATQRLGKKKIVCLDQDRLDVCGQVQLFCFDKTGTLTEPTGLSLQGIVLPANQKIVQDVELLPANQKIVQDVELLPVSVVSSADSLIARLGATCHSLASFQGQLVGPAVEVEMFRAFSWQMNTVDCYFSPSKSIQLVVKQRFPFDANLRTMSVVVLAEENEWLRVFVKGAPEALKALCNQDADFLNEAEALARQGKYVLAMGTKLIPRNYPLTNRLDLEANLEYLGLLVFGNQVKQDAQSAILALKQGQVRTVMITGDNLLCGVFVAKEVGLFNVQSEIALASLDITRKEIIWTSVSRGEVIADVEVLRSCELAIPGNVFDNLRLFEPNLFVRLLPRIRVFARMDPEQKVACIEAFKDMGLVVAMAGDGGNDTGALRCAHVGLSYSCAEASVVAPFNAQNDHVFSCVHLLLEGRASLCTSLASYKFLVLYGLVFSLVKCISFYYGILMSLMGYLLIDVCAMVPLTFAMTLSSSLEVLKPQRPTSALLGYETCFSIVGIWLLVFLSLIINFSLMRNAEGYVRWPSHLSKSAMWWVLSDNWESSVLFTTCYLLFISSSLVFSLGNGYRQSRNGWVFSCWLALFSLTSLAWLLPLNYWISIPFHASTEEFNRLNSENYVWQRYQEMGGRTSPAMSLKLRVSIWLVCLCATALSFVWEKYVVFGLVSKKKPLFLNDCV